MLWAAHDFRSLLGAGVKGGGDFPGGGLVHTAVAIYGWDACFSSRRRGFSLVRAAPEYAEVGGGLFCWQAYDSASKVDLHASAVAVDGRLFFVDPIALAEPALAELTADTAPAGIVLTNANHARAAEGFRRRFEIPVCFHPGASGEIGLTADAVLPAEGGPVFGGVFEAIPLPGAAPGEIALYRAAGGGLLVVGDAVINLPSPGFAVLPDKYCAIPKLLRRSLSGLLERPFTRMLFAHGDPIVTDARKRLASMLAA